MSPKRDPIVKKLRGIHLLSILQFIIGELMKITVSILIDSSREKIWKVITDIENLPNIITAIHNIDVIISPDEGIVGLKWKETRKLYGLKTSEVMWIEEAQEYNYYSTKASSNGTDYISYYSLEDEAGKIRLTMEFIGKPRTKLSRFLFMTSRLLKRGRLKREMERDLVEVKRFCERTEPN